ncbi:hypothetical protein SAMN04488029_0912 [Reichenbachiella faecimaris]|uniref:Uncharacterized protein n=1 Tax=Reichenbachiella faecimaris TaxID=692418 RepID=A0A1W2G7A8_REIFA|nr:hypothetical protein [Reichenbachiella faecimaris]SMD32565.1 hypothetical protein SAMN04488029_0912 [Reichenbachiella faecimaris]
MAREKKFTVRHFLNKRLPPEVDVNNNPRYPLYIRLRYNNKPVEIRSHLASYSEHVERDEYSIQEFSSSVEFWDFGYLTEQQFSNPSEMLRNTLEKEVELCQKIFRNFYDKGENLLDLNVKGILDIYLNPIFLSVDFFLGAILKDKLVSSGYSDVKYKLLSTPNKFSEFFTPLRSISSDSNGQTAFYLEILKPFEVGFALLERMLETQRSGNIITTYEMCQVDAIESVNFLSTDYRTEEIELLQQTCEYYLRTFEIVKK